MRTRSLAAALFLSLASSQIRAHDFWIEPSTYRPRVGSVISARAFVGQDFRGDAIARNESRIVRFVLAGPSEEQPLLGRPGADPAGIARLESSGLHVIGYESRPSSVELSVETLQNYIEEEGLEPFFGGDPSKPIRDHFSRCAKSIVLAGDAGSHSKGYDRRLGCTLELIPERNPYALGKSAKFPVRLVQGGKPLEGALVVAMERGHPERKLTGRTDAQGRVRFELPVPGVWLIKSVWVRPVTGKDDEWESFWASLTFEVPGNSRSGSD